MYVSLSFRGQMYQRWKRDGTSRGTGRDRTGREGSSRRPVKTYVFVLYTLYVCTCIGTNKRYMYMYFISETSTCFKKLLQILCLFHPMFRNELTYIKKFQHTCTYSFMYCLLKISMISLFHFILVEMDKCISENILETEHTQPMGWGKFPHTACKKFVVEKRG